MLREKVEKISIVKETSRAYLIKKGNKQAWIQKRWLREDGTLTPAGEKNLEEAKSETEKAKEKEERQRREKIGVARPQADWESEKAYGYDVRLDFYDREITRKHRIFIPKSIIQENGNIPTWFLRKKFRELNEAYPHNKYGGFDIDYHPFRGHYE